MSKPRRFSQREERAKARARIYALQVDSEPGPVKLVAQASITVVSIWILLVLVFTAGTVVTQ